MPTHFTPAALKFLRGLVRNNDREWFAARKSIYEDEVKAPMLALVGEINEALLEFAPDHARPPHKAMMRIYRDTRFSADKSPYKKHVAAWWARSGMEKTSGAGFYLAISATHVTVAAGIYMPTPDQLLAIRRHLLIHHAELRAIFAAPKVRTTMQELDGQRLSRAPRGFPADSPGIDLILHRQWGVSATLPADIATAPALLSEIASRFAAAAPLVHFLNAPLVKVAPSRISPLF